MGRKLTKLRPKQGAHIAALRKAAGLSQAQLADLIGETQQNIAFWEVNDKPPRADALPKLAKALGVEIADLIIDAHSKGKKNKPVPAKLRLLVDQIIALPRYQQDKIIDALSLFLLQFQSQPRPKSKSRLKSKSKSKSKSSATSKSL